ncbi:hypothetical protein SDC9_184997 [bioreactor metagenome]|uniref:Uncharacterized protein n=1 Tax=bioreactor metagenome TaxID=1076179 RepID=A0A645HEL7_9ZZZZ
MQRGLHAVDHQCVARVVAALEAHDALCALGQPIDQLALAFVTPLGADDHDVTTLACLHFESDPILKNQTSDGAHDPAVGHLHQFAVTVKLIHFALMPGQNADHRLALLAQRGNGIGDGAF